MKTEDDFDSRYTSDGSIVSAAFDSNNQIGMLETYGNDVKQVLEIYNRTPKKVWTMLEGDEGIYLVQGFHYINRMYYVITVEEASEENEEYLIQSHDEE